jgi:hypothetical protein
VADFRNRERLLWKIFPDLEEDPRRPEPDGKAD